MEQPGSIAVDVSGLGISASASDCLAVSEEQVRERQHGQCEESQKGGGPLVTEAVVHLVAKQRKGGCILVRLLIKSSLTRFGHSPANVQRTKALAPIALAA
jgi:hypothetical protein